MERLLALRQKYRQRCRMWMIAGIIAALLLVCVAIAFLSQHQIL
jgi:hypothetical protein